MITNIARNLTGNGAAPTFVTMRMETKEGLLQVDNAGGATITMYGRIAPEAPWFQMDSFNASTIRWIALAPEMYLAVTGYASGSISAWLME